MGRRIEVLACAGAVLGFGCAEPRSGGSTPPDDQSAAVSSEDKTRSTNPDCAPGGPSVSVNVSRESGDRSISRDDLGVLLGWVGGFVQPCIDEPSQAHHITLVFVFGGQGQAPTFEFVEREQLPTMAACLDEGFAGAPAPPPGAKRVSIVVPWGCPTLGPGYQGGGVGPDESAPPAEGAEGTKGTKDAEDAEAPAADASAAP
ncbi:MAG: hypothetical protein AAGF11_41255 [Myxococcota bacterium]